MPASLARKPARGNWIWLGGALAAVVLAVVAVGTGIVTTGARGTAKSLAPIGPAGPGTLSGGPAARRATAGPGGGSFLAGTSAVAVFYDPGNAVGSCTLGPFPASGRYVSLPPQRFGDSAACGSYITVAGPRGQVRAQVVDLCPGCAANMINLSRAAFRQIASPGPGSAMVSYWPVLNPPLPGPLLIRTGTTRTGRPALQIRHHGNPLTAVAVAIPGIRPPAWRAFILNANGIWVGSARLGRGPFSVRITDDQGHQVILPGIRLRPARLIHTHQWMYARSKRRAYRRASHRSGGSSA